MSVYNIVVLDGNNDAIHTYSFVGKNNKQKQTLAQNILEKGKQTKINETIYIDDTVETIKKKILKYCDMFRGKRKLFEEIYLFSKNPIGLTLPKTIPANPLHLSEYVSDVVIVPQEKKLLLNFQPITDNNIFLCLVENVILQQSNQMLEKKLALYFPYLADKSINSSDQLEIFRTETRDSQLNNITDSIFIRDSKNIDIFKDISNSASRKNKKIEGIKKIVLTITPTLPVLLSLVDVFNLFHATKEMPLIQLNASKTSERQFRLYAPDTAKNGMKIPYLKKSTIEKLRKNFGENKRVMIYMRKFNDDVSDFEIDDDEHFIACEIISTNNTIVFKFTATFKDVIEISEAENVIKTKMNNIIEILNDHIENSGDHIMNFDSFEDDNVTLNDVAYEISFKRNKIDIVDKVKCISSVFGLHNIKDNEARMMYKRVTNYNDKHSRYVFLNEMKNEANIFDKFKKIFNLSQKEAIKEYNEFNTNEENISKNKIKIYSGFPTTIISDKFLRNKTKSHIITVSGIDNIGYLQTIPMFLRALVEIISTETVAPNSLIKQLCDNNQKYSQSETIDNDEQSDIELSDETSDSSDDSGHEESDDEEPDEEEPHEEEPDDKLRDDKQPSDEQPSDEQPSDEQPSDKQSSDKQSSDKQPADSDSDSDSDSEDGSVASKDDDGEIEEQDIDDAVDRLLRDEYESASDESDDDNMITDSTTGGAVNNVKDKYKDLVGMPLHPIPILTKLHEKDPILFPKVSKGKFNSYSRSCPEGVRRQPVILTEEEYSDISKNHRGSYETAISYGTSEDKKYWYICPKYWALQENRSLTKEEVESGMYGEIIPKQAKTIPEGGNILELGANRHPGFLEPDKHPQGKCMPCCFQNQGGVQKRRRTICKNEMEGKNEDKDVKYDSNNYIQGQDRFPLEEHKNGYLEPRILNLLGLNKSNMDCKINNKSSENKICLLRKGVEVSDTQSFIASIAKIQESKSQKGKPKQSITITDMKEKIINKLNLDNYVAIQNGNLVNMFDTMVHNDEEHNESVTLIDDKYRNTKLYKITNFKDEEQVKYINKVIRSLNNYIDFLSNNEVTIDHIYLWDFICMEKMLTKRGRNMIILEINNDDSTDNVNILCPTNHYSNTLYDDNKKTIILFKKNNFFEPIFQKIGGNDVYEFDLSSNSKIKNALLKIKKITSENCGSKKSDVLEFEMNITATEIENVLSKIFHTGSKDLLYQRTKYLLNYDGKIIGLFLEQNSYAGIEEAKGEEQDVSVEDFLVPCLPSPLKIHYDDEQNLDDSKYIWIHDEYSKKYGSTKIFLYELSDNSDGEIKCKPKFKILEDGVIVGILTETNQFVPVLPEENFDDDLPTVEESNYIVSETKLSKKGYDKERINTIARVRLETRYYNVFRTTARIVLGYTSNTDTREELETIIKSSDKTYIDKLRETDLLVQELLLDYVDFDEDYNIDEMITSVKSENIKPCLSMKRKCVDNKYCKNTDNGVCMLILPANNLLNGVDNKQKYFGRLADELIRYSRMRSFILNEKDSFINIANIKMVLNDDEILMWNSEITQEHFQSLKNKDVKNNYKKADSYEMLYYDEKSNDKQDIDYTRAKKNITWSEFTN